MKIVDSAKGDGLLVEYLNENVKKVLCHFSHGIGDLILFRAPLEALRKKYPHIKFDVGLSPHLGQECVIPGSIALDGNFKSTAEKSGYDIVFICHFPMENQHDLTLTKAEICCIQELGIEPTPGHLPLRPKPLIGVHFQTTSVPDMTNPDAKVAEQIWQDIESVGCVPIETQFEHVFHNPINKKHSFIDFHVRSCDAKMEHLISLLGSCFAFVGVVSGNFHLAMAILPYTHVLLLEKKLKVPHFTKLPIASANVDNYNGEVKQWLGNLLKTGED